METAQNCKSVFSFSFRTKLETGQSKSRGHWAGPVKGILSKNHTFIRQIRHKKYSETFLLSTANSMNPGKQQSSFIKTLLNSEQVFHLCVFVFAKYTTWIIQPCNILTQISSIRAVTISIRKLRFPLIVHDS